ncbi:MAG TPA: TetR/AcrR family transcriptional regulator [Solirubrobacteraceae bacterium]
MSNTAPAVSPRRDELLERAYGYVLEHGLAGMSLRPLSAAIRSSPRVLLFLFGSKDELVRALLARARAEELELLSRMPRDGDGELAAAASQLWRWLSAEEHRGLLRLWVESYARSLVELRGPWAGFARATVEDWLGLLAAAQPRPERDSPVGEAQRTLVLALLRGALLDLLATGDHERTTQAVQRGLTHVTSA